ncbi:hypothetical protein SO802_009146 [Lithocarpus litseifolius]|uniref:Myb/SANT-like domain-containing protein n=1 Tax=Lithocarpus litseifolius TaxID=425828 RepID=A0AAW2DDE9_9ROSI
MKGNSSIDEDTLWTPQLEKLFIDIMLKEINKGNTADGQFSSDTWKKMLATLNELGKWSFTMTQFKGKFNRMRLLHHEFSTLINQIGFGWDAETNTVHALEEPWQNYCQLNIVEYNTAHPKAKTFRTKGLSNYNLIGLIFNKSTATGVLHCASTQDPPNLDEKNALEERLIHGGVHAAKARIEASKAKAERYKTYTIDEVSSSIAPTNDFSLGKCINILETVEVNDEIFMKAVEKFKQDPDDREIFVNMSFARRMEGTANDTRVFLDALKRPENNFPWPPFGGYYLVDSGYPCTLGFLPLYRTERYHLRDFQGGDRLEGAKELFNYRHSSLRNVIEDVLAF